MKVDINIKQRMAWIQKRADLWPTQKEFVEFQIKDAVADVLKQVENNCVLPVVMASQFEAYAAFCIELDRQGMKPVKYIDYLEIG